MSILVAAAMLVQPPIMITNGWCDANFVTVQFGTTNEPPYLVGIYDAVDAQFAASQTTRSRPLGYRIVGEKQATLAFSARGTRERTFIQVGPVSWTNAPGFRIKTMEEMRSGRVGNFWAGRGTIRSGEENAWLPYPYLPQDKCSQEVPLPVMFRSLSANDEGVRIGVDWIGNVVFIAETNASPNRIYWEGIR